MNRSSWLWPLLILLGAVLLFVWGVGALPPAAADLIGRGWPIALVLLGLSTLLGRRVRYANLIVIGVCVALLAGVIVTAYGRQSARFRDDYKQHFEQALPADVKSIRINVTTLLTQLTIDPADARTIVADFAGSQESRVTSNYTIDQGIATFSVIETRPSNIPLLEAMGHGKLTLKLPVGLPIDQLTIKGGEGDLALDITGTSVRNLDARITGGDINLTLPPLTPQEALGGSVRTGSGNLIVNVPPGLTLKLTVESGKAGFDPANYLLLSGGVLQSAGTRDFQVVLTVSASGNVSLKP